MTIMEIDEITSVHIHSSMNPCPGNKSAVRSLGDPCIIRYFNKVTQIIPYLKKKEVIR